MVEIRGNATGAQVPAMLAVADSWKRIGVDVETIVMAPQRAQDREYRFTRPAFEVSRNDNEVDSPKRFHGSQAPRPENNFVGTNRNRYLNAEFDAVIDAYFRTIPRQERMAALGQIIHHMTDRVTTINLFYDVETALVSNRLQHVSFRPAWNAHEWDIG